MTERIDGGVLASQSAPPSAPSSPRGASTAEPGTGHFAALLRQVGREIERGEALVGQAATGRFQAMDAGRLIALQAGIYRYSEAIDLTVKLVDRATSGVKTVLEAGR
jgi:hypothetical protein